jgi:lipid A ethanolaminephosphotransferase
LSSPITSLTTGRINAMPIRSVIAKSHLSGNALILIVSAFLIVTGNGTFIANVLKAYPLTWGNIAAILSLIIVVGGTTVLLLAVLCFKHTTKPVLIAILLLSSLSTYFMDNYGIIISDDMLRNIAYTHTAEAMELLNTRLLAYVMLLGLVPAFAVAKAKLRWIGLRGEVIARMTLLASTLALIIATVLGFGGFYASLFREHRELRQHLNPLYYLYSTAKYASQLSQTTSAASLAAVGADAAIPASDVTRELIFLVVGETARADRFSLNGYARDTNPQLRQRKVISFVQFRACGTSTAVSVPCMFLLDGESKDASAIKTQENLLDILRRSGVNVLWRDNNSDSKGVASRVTYEDFRSSTVNPICDIECRDEGMLEGLQDYIDSHPKGDILVVLHQMGNHGPAYFRRYPPEFERFRPACKSSDLGQCSREEIGNAYDNAILYTDHFLAKAIDLLQANDSRFETALLYVSDHGESLGENGLYLHGLPKAIAPDTQLRVPAVMWFGSNFHAVAPSALREKVNLRFTHDNVFHTVLGLFEIDTKVYRASMDMINAAKPQQ